MRLVRCPSFGEPIVPACVHELRGRPGALAELRVAELRRVPELGPSAFVLDETKQHTGSFKVRGAIAAIANAQQSGVGEVVTASAGNHGAGIAYASRLLGARATVFVPRSAPIAKRSKIEGPGVTLRVVPTDHFDAAEQEAKKYAAASGIPFVSAYEDDIVAAGNGATLAFELVSALGKVPDVVLCPLGGGGLASGVVWGLSTEAGERKCSAPAVFGVQSEASPSTAMSLERGSAVTYLEGEPTWADGLEGGISERGFARVKELIRGVYVVDEAAVRRAMQFCKERLAIRAEGSGAIAIAPLLEGLAETMTVVAILSGSNVDDAIWDELSRANVTNGDPSDTRPAR
jgi:threonine dehydratase